MAKKTKGKTIKVTKAKGRKKPKQSKKRKRGRKGRGHYSNFFPTNRTIDSNQYWQLRAEIAGAEARVRSSLKDRKDEESKAEKRAEDRVGKLEKQVETVAARTPVALSGDVGTPEYDRTDTSSADRDSARDSHTVDLTTETPYRRHQSPRSPSDVYHRGETFEDQQQRKQQRLRDAISLRRQHKVRNVENIVSRWRTIAKTSQLGSELQRAGEPTTPHNLSINLDTPTRETIESVTEHGAPPSTFKLARQRQRAFFISGEQSATTPEDVLTSSRGRHESGHTTTDL